MVKYTPLFPQNPLQSGSSSSDQREAGDRGVPAVCPEETRVQLLVKGARRQENQSPASPASTNNGSLKKLSRGS